MFQIKIIGVGRIRERYLQEGIKEYVKRLGTYAKIDILEVSDEPCPERLSHAEEEQVLRKEGERILKTLSTQDYVILLDIRGREMTSPAAADWLESLALDGKSSLVFIIGGSLGVSAAVRQRADFRWSFSPLTFPHPLMRLLLLEQIYRAMRIRAGEPYHK